MFQRIKLFIEKLFNPKLGDLLDLANELLDDQDRVITSLQRALADANDRTMATFSRGRETIAALLMASGGEALISKEMAETCNTMTDYIINVDVKDDGAVLLSLVPGGETEEAAVPAATAEEAQAVNEANQH